MKTIAALGLLSMSASAAVVRRQHDMSNMGGGGLGGFSLPKGFSIPGFDINNIAKSMPKEGLAGLLSPSVRKAYKIEQMEPRINPAAKRVKITYGPYKIRAANSKEYPGNSFSMDPAGTGYQNLAGPDFPRDIMLLEGQSFLFNETFQKARIEEGIYNHHIVFTDANRPVESWLACNGKSIPSMPISIFLGAGSEDIGSKVTAASKEVKSGYYIGKNDVISFGMDIVNYENREQTLYMVNELEYLPGKPEGYTHAQSHVITMGMCDGIAGYGQAMNIHPPKDKKKFVLAGKNDIEVAKDGWMIGTYGHLHDGGLKMIMTVNGKEVCTSNIIYGGPGHEQVQPNGEIWKTIGETIGCNDPIRVSKGDKIQMQAFFDFEEHPPRHSAHGEEAEGMALMGTTFVPLTSK